MPRIIDAHFHIFKYREHWSEWAAKRWIQEMPVKHYWYTNKDLVPEDFNAEYDWAVEQMDASGVDAAMLLGNFQEPHGIRVPISYVMEAVEKHPTRFYGFASPNPLGGYDSLKQLDEAFDHPGFYGLKILPTYNYVAFTDRRVWPLLEMTAAKGKCLVIHTGFGPVAENRLSWQRPYELEDLLVALPGFRVSMGHSGFHRFMDAALLMTKYPDLYGDMASWSYLPIDYVARSLVFAKAMGVLNHVMWGTDFPHVSPAEDRAKYQRLPEYTRENNLEPYITEDDLSGLFGGNAARFLGVDG